MAARRGFGLLLVAIVVGLIVGSLLGDLLGQLVGPAWLREFLTKGPTIGITPPATLDLRLLSVTFGILLKINVVGVLGVLVAFLLIRRS